MFSKKQRKILVIVFMVSIASSLVGLFLSFHVRNFGTMMKIILMAMPQRQFISNTNILIAGVDNSVEGTNRADTIMVANINPYTQYVGILAIPRDTRLNIPGRGLDKINHAYAYGGIELMKQSLSNFLQIPIPYHIIIDLDGVAEIVDHLGGIPINVEQRMYYVDRAGGLYIDLYPGQQVLDGDKSLQYVRFRSDGQGDIGRIERQQKFIQAAGSKIANIGVIFKAPAMIMRFSRFVKTNVPPNLMVDFALRLKEAYQLGHLDIKTLPSKPVIINNISYQQPDWTETQQMVMRVIKGYELSKGPLSDFKKPPELPIEILNGNGIAGMGKNAERKLKQIGHPIHYIGNAERMDYDSTILINWHGLDLEDEAFSLARKLYIHPANIFSYNQPSRKAPFTIILGHDWPIAR